MSSHVATTSSEPLGVSTNSNDVPNGQKKRRREGPYRGESKALKYRKLRKTQPSRIPITIPEKWGAVVGERASQFVAECSYWVKEICPLNVEKWDDMPKENLEQLYNKIKTKYLLTEAAYVTKALKKQCSSLYRKWRERLKKKHFVNRTNLREVELSCPSGIDKDQWRWLVYHYWNSNKQMERSEKNRSNALSMKIRSATGSKSIARVVHEIDAENESSEITQASSSNSALETQVAEPKYIQLWIKTKRHKDGMLDEEAESILAKFRELHSKTVEENGVDEMSIEEAYEKVLGHSSGHARGLERGHTVPSKRESVGRIEFQQFQLREQELRDEMERKEKESREREQELRAEVEQKEKEAKEREQELRAEIQKKEKEAMERESKLRDDLQAQITRMFSQITGAGGNLS